MGPLNALKANSFVNSHSPFLIPLSSMEKIRVLIADDHQVMRRGVRAVVELLPGWEVCGEASTGRDAVEMAQRLLPEIVVMDVTMPELNGLDPRRSPFREDLGDIVVIHQVPVRQEENDLRLELQCRA